MSRIYQAMSQYWGGLCLLPATKNEQHGGLLPPRANNGGRCLLPDTATGGLSFPVPVLFNGGFCLPLPVLAKGGFLMPFPASRTGGFVLPPLTNNGGSCLLVAENTGGFCFPPEANSGGSFFPVAVTRNKPATVKIVKLSLLLVTINSFLCPDLRQMRHDFSKNPTLYKNLTGEAFIYQNILLTSNEFHTIFSGYEQTER